MTRRLDSSCRRSSEDELICPSCQYAADISACDDGQITGSYPRVFRPHEGRFAIVTKRWAEDAVDAAAQTTDAQSRTAKPRGPDASTLASSLATMLRIAPDDGDNKPDRRGERGISR
jgi:hypothetical protein